MGRANGPRTLAGIRPHQLAGLVDPCRRCPRVSCLLVVRLQALGRPVLCGLPVRFQLFPEDRDSFSVRLVGQQHGGDGPVFRRHSGAPGSRPLSHGRRCGRDVVWNGPGRSNAFATAGALHHRLSQCRSRLVRQRSRRRFHWHRAWPDGAAACPRFPAVRRAFPCVREARAAAVLQSLEPDRAPVRGGSRRVRRRLEPSAVRGGGHWRHAVGHYRRQPHRGGPRADSDSGDPRDAAPLPKSLARGWWRPGACRDGGLHEPAA